MEMEGIEIYYLINITVNSPKHTIMTAILAVVYIMDIIRQPKMTKYKAYIELLKHFKHLQIYFKPHKGIF